VHTVNINTGFKQEAVAGAWALPDHMTRIGTLTDE
jgi:hypothetical protein